MQYEKSLQLNMEVNNNEAKAMYVAFNLLFLRFVWWTLPAENATRKQRAIHLTGNNRVASLIG